MPLTVRQGVELDFRTIQKIEKNAAQKFASIGYDFCADAEVRSVDEISACLEKGSILLAHDQEQAIGFALLLPVDNSAHLLELAVIGSHQGIGAGSALLEACENWAHTRNFPEITLTTFTEVPWNAPYYARRGYTPFTVDKSRPRLLDILDDEENEGLNTKPRTAMRKSL